MLPNSNFHKLTKVTRTERNCTVLPNKHRAYTYHHYLHTARYILLQHDIKSYPLQSYLGFQIRSCTPCPDKQLMALRSNRAWAIQIEVRLSVLQ